jgi:hypothetical protein
MLLCLAADGVNAYSLPALALRAQAARTRGATAFSFDAASGLLVAAARRRLVLARHDGREFVDLREIALPEAALSVLALGEAVFAALPREVVCAEAAAGALAPVLAAPGGAAALARAGGEALVTRGAETFFFGEGGRRAGRDRRLAWGAPPLALAVAPPYAFARLPAGVEARLLAPFSDAGLRQVLPLPGVAALAAGATADGSLFAIDAAGGLVRLAPAAQRAQARQMLELGEFEEALALCRAMPAASPARRELEDAAHAAHARHLLRARRFEDALAAFGQCRAAGASDLLRSFPFLVPGPLRGHLGAGGGTDGAADADADAVVLDLEEPEERARAAAAIAPYLLSFRSRLAAEGALAARAPAAELVDTALLCALLAQPDAGALLQLLERPNAVHLAAGEAALSAAGRYAELVALYKAHGRHAEALDLLQALSLSPGSLSAPPAGAAAELRGGPGVWAAVRYLVTAEEAVDFRLAAAHARWILRGDAEAGLEMFAALRPPPAAAAVLPLLTAHAPELAGRYLEAALAAGTAERDVHERELAALYLQRLAAAADAGPRGAAEALPEHGKLVALVLASEHLDAAALLRLLPPGRLLEARAALLERLGRDLEALRLLVHRLARPDLAEAYADRAAARRGAEAAALAGGEGAAAAPGAAEPYLLLVRVLLEEEAGGGEYRAAERPPDDPRWETVAGLLARKREAVPPAQALAMLPAGVPVAGCLQLLLGAVWGSAERRRHWEVVRGLRAAEHARALAALAAAELRAVVLTHERACCRCFKRLGAAAAVAVLPGPCDRVAHFACLEKK